MELGLNLPVMAPGLDRARLLDWAERIERGPFRSLAAGERINFPNPEPLVALSACAARTERVRLVFSVLVLPTHAPARLAKQIATLDRLSQGRVTLGVGVGGREEDYAALGVPFAGNRWRRMEAGVAELKRLWAGGRTHASALRALEPAPWRAGGPEILAGAMGPRSIERAARWADGLSGFSFGPDPREIEAQFETARRAWRAAGRPAPRLVTSFWFALGPGARAQLDDYLGRYLNFLGAELARKLAPTVRCDDAAKLREAARRMRDLGCDELLLVPTTSDPDEIDRVADLLGGDHPLHTPGN